MRSFAGVALILHWVNQNGGVHKGSQLRLTDWAEARELLPGKTVEIPPVHALEPVLGTNLFPAGSF